MSEYQNKYKGYTLKMDIANPESFDPRNETVEVRLTREDGQVYSANFAARGFIDYMFEKNKRTGECAKGVYFCMPNMILVEEISEQNVRTTIDDLIDQLAIETHFEKVD